MKDEESEVLTLVFIAVVIAAVSTAPVWILAIIHYVKYKL